MSPEQARGLEVDERSDLFSLGVVMYELLTGCAPFQGETTGDVLVALLSGEPRPLARYVAKLPEALQQIVNRALAKSVEQRYQTARELGAELKRLKEELEFAAKVKGRAGSKDDTPTLTVGVAVDAAEHSTFETQQAVKPLALAMPPGGARFAALRGWLRQYGKVLVVAALALVISAAALVWRRLAPQDGAIDSVAVLPFANVGSDPQMHQEAIAQVSQSQTPASIAAKAYLYARAGRRGEALKLLQGLKTLAAREPFSPVSLATICVGLGDKEQALVLLRKAYDERSDHLLHVGASPNYDPLRSDPRFGELLRDIGLTR